MVSPSQCHAALGVSATRRPRALVSIHDEAAWSPEAAWTPAILRQVREYSEAPQTRISLLRKSASPHCGSAAPAQVFSTVGEVQPHFIVVLTPTPPSPLFCSSYTPPEQSPAPDTPLPPTPAACGPCESIRQNPGTGARTVQLRSPSDRMTPTLLPSKPAPARPNHFPRPTWLACRPK